MKKIVYMLISAFIFAVSVFAQNNSADCATIKIDGGGIVNSGEPMNFSANVNGKTKTILLEYEWQVSNGTIASGQGTPSIAIDTTGLAPGTNVTASVRVKGLYDNCVNTVSETGSIMQKIGCGRPLDEFGKQSTNEIKARVAALYVGLSDYPEGQGYIINYGTDEEIAERERQIEKAIRFFKFDMNRITMVRGGENAYETGALTRMWIVPPGAKFPQP